MGISDQWKDLRPGCSVLYVGGTTEPVIVLHVIARKDDEWIVQSSHGAPKGEHPNKQSAQKYAQKFAATQLQRTLTALTELEGSAEPATNGYRPQPCGLLVISIPPSDDHLEPDGSVHPEFFEQQKSDLIAAHRKRITDLLASVA